MCIILTQTPLNTVYIPYEHTLAGLIEYVIFHAPI